MHRFRLFFIIILACTVGVSAAKKEKEKPLTPLKSIFKEARAAIKNKRDQNRHEKTILDALKREGLENSEKAEGYHILSLLNISINDGENLKAYLKQKYDTATYFNTLLSATDYALKCDSFDVMPDQKGRVKPRYRNKTREILLKYRSNIYNGGRFYLRRNEFVNALPFFQRFIEYRDVSLLENEVSVQEDGFYPQVCLYALVSSYNSQQPRVALQYVDEAMSGSKSERLAALQEYKVRCYAMIKDTTSWFRELKVGCNKFPKHDYFFTSLMDYFESQGKYDEGIMLSDSLLNNVGDASLYFYAKSLMFLHKEEWNSCIEMCDSTLKRDSVNSNALYNKGMSYINLAMDKEETANNQESKAMTKKIKSDIADLYRKAQTPFEKLRVLLPDDPKRWAKPLYRVYLNLNKGKEFADIEKILKTIE